MMSRSSCLAQTGGDSAGKYSVTPCVTVSRSAAATQRSALSTALSTYSSIGSSYEYHSIFNIQYPLAILTLCPPSLLMVGSSVLGP